MLLKHLQCPWIKSPEKEPKTSNTIDFGLILIPTYKGIRLFYMLLCKQLQVIISKMPNKKNCYKDKIEHLLMQNHHFLFIYYSYMINIFRWKQNNAIAIYEIRLYFAKIGWIRLRFRIHVHNCVYENYFVNVHIKSNWIENNGKAKNRKKNWFITKDQWSEQSIIIVYCVCALCVCMNFAFFPDFIRWNISNFN